MNPIPHALAGLVTSFAAATLIASPALAGGDIDDIRKIYGAELAGDIESLPGVYVIPMEGQMGTDVHCSIFEDVTRDIETVQPQVIVWALNSADVSGNFIAQSQADPNEAGRLDLDHYRDLINLLQDDPRTEDMRQVMWVHDSEGISSVVALAWPDMYMVPGARLQGLQQLFDGIDNNVQDPEVRAKFLAAVIALSNGFLQSGGYPIELGKAMIDPEHKLSASWVGRQVFWTLGDNGAYLIDNDDKETAAFTAKTAEDFGVSDGTAETLDDLMLLLGYREYRLVAGDAGNLLEKYRTDWRRTYEKATDAFNDFLKHQAWATGGRAGGGGGGVGGGRGRGGGRGGAAGRAAEDQIKYLSMARNDTKRFLAAMNRYEAVEYRLLLDGFTRLNTELRVERLGERIRLLRQAQRDRDDDDNRR